MWPAVRGNRYGPGGFRIPQQWWLCTWFVAALFTAAVLLAARPRVSAEEDEQWDRLPKQCDVFRLLTVADAKLGEGFFNKLRDMQNGLILAKLTRRTFLMPDVYEAYAHTSIEDSISLVKLRRFWPCIISTKYKERYEDVALRRGAKVVVWDKGHHPGGEAWTHQEVANEVERLATERSIMRFVNDTSYWVCPDAGARMQRGFWRHIAPATALHRELSHFKGTALGGRPYAGVHLRSLDRQCHTYFDRLTRPPAHDFGARMCELDWALAEQILRARGVRTSNVFLASDGTNVTTEKSFRDAGAKVYVQTQRPHDWAINASLRREESVAAGHGRADIFLPALDMFLLADSELFIGNMLSTMSMAAANLRQVRGRPSVLGWPQPESAMPYWQCSRDWWWCGGAKVADRHYGSTRRTSCIPDSS